MLFICLDYLFQTIDQLIETGDSEQIFQNAIREQGRGQVPSCYEIFILRFLMPKLLFDF